MTFIFILWCENNFAKKRGAVVGKDHQFSEGTACFREQIIPSIDPYGSTTI